LAFGDAPILRYFFSRGRPILSIDPVIARHELGLTRESFIDLCILCGTDFSGTIQGIGPHRALQWIKKYRSIENILENLHDTTYKPQDTFDYQLARDVFTNLPPIPIHDSDYQLPYTTQSHIDEMIKRYEIDPVEADIKLKGTLLTQNVIQGSSWGSDPFSSITAAVEGNNDNNGALFQFS
jgi:5'-3' exonuclease